MKKQYKLDFEMVPEECWRGNLRSLLSPAQWDVVRKDAYKSAKYKCSICGAAGRLEAHERWSYDDKKALQKLEDVTALCAACHAVKHVSRSYLFGKEYEVMEQFQKVNRCSQMEYHEALKAANKAYQERNAVEGWVTDFSWLKENYNIEV